MPKLRTIFTQEFVPQFSFMAELMPEITNKNLGPSTSSDGSGIFS